MGAVTGLGGCAARVSVILFEHSDLLEQTILVNKEYDEMHQSLREENNPQTFRTRKPNNVACFILFMMMLEH